MVMGHSHTRTSENAIACATVEDDGDARDGTEPGHAVIHVRSLGLDEVPEPAWPALAVTLDDEERARAARIIPQAGHRAFVAAHALLRHLLSDLLGGPAHAWRFARAPGGKPVLAGSHPPSLSFSLSHAAGMVLVCAARQLHLGADIEPVSFDLDPMRLAEHCFSPGEVDTLRRLSGSGLHEGFTTLWTLKEAFLKAIGTGLVRPLDSFAVDPGSGPDSPARLVFVDGMAGDPATWRFWRASRGCHRLAVAFAMPDDGQSVEVRHATVTVPPSLYTTGLPTRGQAMTTFVTASPCRRQTFLVSTTSLQRETTAA